MSIEDLSESERARLYKATIDNLYDRDWCRINDINYVNPDVAQAKRATYNEIILGGLRE